MCKRESKFEALVYTENPGLAATCAAAFAEFPVDWVMQYEAILALEYLSKEQFDFVILDLDSVENCSILLDAVNSGVNLHSVVLAVTSASVNPSILELCYRARVFYPVRPSEIQEQLYRTAPLAERLATQRVQLKETEPSFEVEESVPENLSAELSNLLSVGKHIGKKLAISFFNVLRMKHSLSIIAQERIASVLASFGTMWFVHEITEDFRGVEFIQPPSAGPTYLIALGVLLWLCAKQRRVSESSIVAARAG